MRRMKMLSAKVKKKSQLDLPEDALQEGETVVILVPEQGEEGFHLPEDQRQELLAAIAEAERGETIDARQFLDELGR